MELIEVRPSDEHINVLYRLLQRRVHTISHSAMPSFEDHRNFVLSHPYRAWYLISDGSRHVGSIYLLDTNCMGVSALKDGEHLLPRAIRAVAERHDPLPAIPSVRTASFSVNVAPGNQGLMEILEGLGGEVSQVTYRLPAHPDAQ